MSQSHSKSKIPAQRGYAMLGIIAVLGVAATAVVVTSLSATAVRNEQARRESNALAVAKQALIASAASSNSRPGSLPCPDVDNDGLSDPPDSSAACAALIGRLPWQTLGLPDLRDTAGERLWYATSGNFQDLSTNRINSGVYGQLQVNNGGNYTYGVVAIVFSPGQTVGSQKRDASNPSNPINNNAANFLESYVIATKTATVQLPDGTHNDQLSVITPADVFSVVERRVAQEVHYAMNGQNLWPWPAVPISDGHGGFTFPMNAPSQRPTQATVVGGYIPDNSGLSLPPWFSANLWSLVMSYRVDSDCPADPPPIPPATLACGSAFVGFTIPTTGVFIGSTGGFTNPGTKAIVSFTGVNAAYNNYQTTVLSAAIQ